MHNFSDLIVVCEGNQNVATEFPLAALVTETLTSLAASESKHRVRLNQADNMKINKIKHDKSYSTADQKIRVNRVDNTKVFKLMSDNSYSKADLGREDDSAHDDVERKGGGRGVWRRRKSRPDNDGSAKIINKQHL